MKMEKNRKLALKCLISIMVIAIVCGGFTRAGRFLVLDTPEPSDFVVIPAEDFNDDRVERGLALLRHGYGQQLVLDAPDEIHYGLNEADAAVEYLRRSAPEVTDQVHVCRISRGSAPGEMIQLGVCIKRIEPNATSAVLVTSDYLTRRSLDTARHVLPRYHWSVAAAREFEFGPLWWRNRESAKVVLTEWQRLLWWTIIERWTADKID
jgi:hypothetical protein